MFENMHSMLNRLPVIYYVLLFYILTFIGVIPFFLPGFILNFDEIDKFPSTWDESILIFILVSVVIVPIIETYIFQGLILNLLKNKFKNDRNHFKKATVSALAFGLFHWYNLKYVLVAIIVGYILAYARLFKIEDKKDIFYVIIIHSLRNFTSGIVIYAEMIK